MHSRTITHTEDGPVTLSLDITAGPIAVRVEEGRTRAEVTLSETFEGDERARKLINDTTTTSTGREFAVNVPRGQNVTGGAFTTSGSGSVHNYASGNISNLIQAGNINGPLNLSGGRAFVDGIDMTNQGSAPGGMIAVTVTLPADSAVKVETTSSDLKTTGHLKSVRYRGKGGEVEVDTTDDLDVDTSGGGIRAERADNAEVNTSGGTIRLGATANADLHTSGGNLVIKRLAGRAKLRTSGGNIDVHAVGTSTIKARTSGGDIEVTKESGIEVDCDATTSGGRVRTPNR